MAASNDYLDFVVEWMAPLGRITARRMMGGYVLYCDAVVFALIAQNTLYLKVDAETRERFESLKLKPFRPFEGKGSMSYYPPPAEFFEDSDAMTEWGRMAVGAGMRAGQKKAKKKSAVRGK